MEKTLVLIKPDAFQRALVGCIITRLEQKGLQLVGAKMMHLADNLLDRHYAHLHTQPFFREIKDFMKSGPVLATCWVGAEAVSTVRNLCGVTKARAAAPGTIRGDFGMSIQCNLIHASESLEAATSELQMFFDDGELFAYSLITEPFLYSSRERKEAER